MSRSDETSTRTRGMPRWDARRSLVLGVVLGAVSLALVSAPAAFAVERHSGNHVAPVLDTDHKRMYRPPFASAERRIEQIKRQGWRQLADESRRRKRAGQRRIVAIERYLKERDPEAQQALRDLADHVEGHIKPK